MNELRKTPEDPTYSICIPNYNMGDTLERALTSVMDQIDSRFEVLILDDGSTDNSRDVIDMLKRRYPRLRSIYLKRDRKRQLGETRNITVREARGEYVILHVDADDVWEPFIADFIEVFHRLERQYGRDILLSGQQINIGRRSFLMRYGPYRNTHRAQDRDLWLRAAADDAYVPLDHRVFRTRLTRPRKIRHFKAVRDSWFHMLYDLRRGTGLSQYVLRTLVSPIWKGPNNFTLRFRIFRSLAVLPGLVVSRFMEPLPPPSNMQLHGEFVDYREKTRGTYAEIMTRLGGDPDLSFLRPDAQQVFSERH